MEYVKISQKCYWLTCFFTNRLWPGQTHIILLNEKLWKQFFGKSWCISIFLGFCNVNLSETPLVWILLFRRCEEIAFCLLVNHWHVLNHPDARNGWKNLKQLNPFTSERVEEGSSSRLPSAHQAPPPTLKWAHNLYWKQKLSCKVWVIYSNCTRC